MQETTENPCPVTRTMVPEERRLDAIGARFGIWYPLTVEPVIYSVTEKLTQGEYHGGYWNMYELSNGGYYTAPDGEYMYHVTCENFWEGNLSSDALGITVCLYAFSRLSYSENPVFGKLMAEHYYWLREFIYEHPEAAGILGATD